LAQVEERLAAAHRPYHQAVAELLQNAVAYNGIGILLDLHSMPSLPKSGEALAAPSVVIGNRFGHSAGGWATVAAGTLCDRFGFSWRENSPYSGGYIVERHGAPSRGVHAIQIEIDRSLYLDPKLSRPDPAGLGRMQEFVLALVETLGAAALDQTAPLAAE
jgi:N-formylglutamate amidohydrolase